MAKKQFRALVHEAEQKLLKRDRIRTGAWTGAAEEKTAGLAGQPADFGKRGNHFGH